MPIVELTVNILGRFCTKEEKSRAIGWLKIKISLRY